MSKFIVDRKPPISQTSDSWVSARVTQTRVIISRRLRKQKMSFNTDVLKK